MAKFKFKIEKYDLFRKTDEFEYWISAKDKFEAFVTMRNAYPEKLGYLFELLETENYD